MSRSITNENTLFTYVEMKKEDFGEYLNQSMLCYNDDINLSSLGIRHSFLRA